MFGCTKCDILRFRQAAGSNDYTITDMIAGLYANHEIILSGYNIFKGTPFNADDEGISQNIFLLDRSQTSMDSSKYSYPSQLIVKQK